MSWFFRKTDDFEIQSLLKSKILSLLLGYM